MYDSVLIPTDGSDGARMAARHGFAFARAYDATPHVLSVVDTRTYSESLADMDELVRRQREAQETGAQQAIDDTVAGHEGDVVEAVAHGLPAEAIVDYADREGIDLIAMGTHGRGGLDRLVIGSVAERVVRTSEVPVLTAQRGPADDDDPYRDVLVPTDGSDLAMAAAAHAIDAAEHFDATLHAINVVDLVAITGYGAGTVLGDTVAALEDAGESAVDDVAELARDAGVAVTTAVLEDRPHAAIETYVREHGIDLVTMGTHGRTGLDRLLIGSVAERTIRTSEVPVLTVRENPDR